MDVDIHIEIKADDNDCIKKYTFQDTMQIEDYNLLIYKITDSIRAIKAIQTIYELNGE